MDQKSWQLVAAKPLQTNNVGTKHAVPAGRQSPVKTPDLESTKLKVSVDPMPGQLDRVAYLRSLPYLYIQQFTAVLLASPDRQNFRRLRRIIGRA